MVVDFERSWLRLREHVLSKRSHGQSDLLEQMARIELENEIPEDQVGFSDLPVRPSRVVPARDEAMASH
jgi:hypothetical protein